MLIGFKLRNFRSFAGEQILSYATSPKREHESTHCIRTGIKSVPRLSRSALLFGPNASGKTNVIIALSTLRELVLHSTGFEDTRFRELYTPFQFDQTQEQSTEFEVDVLLDDGRYRYTIAYDARRITSERLLVYRTGKSQRWFDRHFDADRDSEVWTPFSPSFNGAREMWRKATRPTALFLTTAAQLNSERLLPLFRWFEHGIEIVFRNDVADLARATARVHDVDFKARALSLFQSADIPITDLRVADHETPPIAVETASAHRLRGGLRQQIEFLHSPPGQPPVWLQSSFEAAGTHRLLALLGPLLATMDQSKLLVIDEFDSSLHPLLARFLLQIINDPAITSHRAQVLFTSHNTTLMDLDILRRDEIWLVELDEHHASIMSTVLRSSPRKGAVIGKGYLRGNYGAVPDVRNKMLLLSIKPKNKPTRPFGKAREAS